LLLFIEPIAALFWSVLRLPASPEIPLRGLGGTIRKQARFLGKPVRAAVPRNSRANLRKSTERDRYSQANAWIESPRRVLERFQTKWMPVRVKKTRQIKNLERRFDSVETGL
jgi:hypothetical protein